MTLKVGQVGTEDVKSPSSELTKYMYTGKEKHYILINSFKIDFKF